MFSLPSAIVLSLIFVLVAGYCAWAWLSRRSANGVADPEQVVDVNHTIMGILMVVMVWWPSGQLGSWVQAGILAVFLVLQIYFAGTSSTVGNRIDYLSHGVLNLAMIWMLLAMPLLMGGAGADGGGAHEGHGGGADGSAESAAAQIPGWVEPVNMIMIGASIAVAVWWVIRTVRAPAGHRTHDLCHALCGAGMAAMLALM